jgi:hypothetical protein
MNSLSGSTTNRPPLAPHPSFPVTPTHHSTKDQGFGGFPMPHEIISNFFHHFFPKVEATVKRTMTIPMNQTITSQHGTVTPGARVVPYITFEAIVGRNSTFHMLTNEQIEELCGVEFKALNALLWIVPTVRFISYELDPSLMLRLFCSIIFWFNCCHLLLSLRTSRQVDGPVTLILPICTAILPPLGEPCPSAFSDRLHETIGRFAMFQVVSAYTNSGTSLVDQSMIPFQRAYPMIFVLIFVIIAGNTGFVSHDCSPAHTLTSDSIDVSPFCKFHLSPILPWHTLNLVDSSLRFMM